MDPIPHNFYYDPIRQGTGRGVWNWISGSPFTTGGYLTILNARGVMYYDCGKGCLSFTLNVPSDPAGEDRQWGFKASDDYVLFDISSNTLQAKTYSIVGQLSTSVNIPWDSAWTGADVTFMIRWEAGQAVFYVNNIVRARISDASIPCGPMSPFIYSDGGDLFLLKSVVGQGLQTLVLNPVETASDSPAAFGIAHDALTTTEAITTATTGKASPVSADALSVVENVSVQSDLGDLAGIVDTASAAEDVVTAGDLGALDAMVDTGTITEDTVITNTNLGDLAAIGEDATVSDVLTDVVLIVI